MKVDLYHTSTELKQLFCKEKDSRLANRIRAVYLAILGKSAPQIATLLGYSRPQVQDWIYAYNQKGLEGLKDAPGRDTSSKLTTEQLQWFRQRIDEGPGPKRMSVSCGARRFNKLFGSSLRSITVSVPSVSSCTGWDTAMSPHGPNNPRETRKTLKSLKKSL